MITDNKENKEENDSAFPIVLQRGKRDVRDNEVDLNRYEQRR